MDAPAIIMMVLFLLVIWGGLALSIVHYARNPDHLEPDHLDKESVTDGARRPGARRT